MSHKQHKILNIKEIITALSSKNISLTTEESVIVFLYIRLIIRFLGLGIDSSSSSCVVLS